MSTDRVVRHRYGAMNQVIESWYGDGQGSTPETHATMTYDRRGLPDQTLRHTAATSRTIADDTRNRAGMVVSRAHQIGSGTPSQATWVYDRLGRVTSETLSVNGDIKAEQVLGYCDSDDLAALTSKTWVAGVWGLSFLDTDTYTYDYDHQHQLLSAEGTDSFVQQMTYMDSGRIATAQMSEPSLPLFSWASESIKARNVRYDYNLNDAHAVTGLRDASTYNVLASYSYDAAGNRTGSSGSLENAKGYQYDAAGQLRWAQNVGSGAEEVYLYAGEGQRLAAVRPSIEARVYAGPLELRVNNSNTVTKRWVHIAHGTTTTRIENGTTAETTLGSTLGHALVSLNASGAMVSSQRYAPSGDRLLQYSLDTNHPHKINGKEEEVVTGLSYYGYRYYDPLSMVWTQADPLYRFAPDVSLEEPRRQNLYTYSGNNPLRYVDPDGREIVSTAAVAIGGLVGTGLAAIYVAAQGGRTPDGVASIVIDMVSEIGQRLDPRPLMDDIDTLLGGSIMVAAEQALTMAENVADGSDGAAGTDSG